MEQGAGMFRYFWIGLGLIIAGLSFVIGFWPAILIIVGVWFLIIYVDKYMGREHR